MIWEGPGLTLPTTVVGGRLRGFSGPAFSERKEEGKRGRGTYWNQERGQAGWESSRLPLGG